MALSRRTFIGGMGAGAAAIISARGHEAWAAGNVESLYAAEATGDLILDSNENPMGPGQHVLDAITGVLGTDGAGAGRYVFAQQGETRAAIANALGVGEKNVLLGAGSSELLRVATDAFTSADRSIVTPDPTFAACARYAELIGHPVQKVSLDPLLRIDLQRMLDAASGAGLAYICNPNNPTATILAATDIRNFVEDIASLTPATTILIDEAYHDYVADPQYDTMLSLAVENPRVIVARTFSKAYGMAGLRLGFAVSHEDTIKTMADLRGMDMYTSFPTRAGAIAAVSNGEYVRQEHERNETVRDFTRNFFREAGFKDSESQANFIFVDLRRSGEAFQKACRMNGVRIRRGPSGYESHVRISLGTMAEMARATQIFEQVLG